MNTLVKRVNELETAVKSEIVERDREIHTAILSILAKRHHFQIGPPGTSKSLLVTRIVDRIGGLGPEDYFRWLLTNHTVPEELFGAVNLPRMRETGDYHRKTNNKLPKAYFVFLDEIWKGNSSILNANLMAMNERLFINCDDDPHIPLISLFGASNELPADESLNALWDRFDFRHEVDYVNDPGSFMHILDLELEDPEPLITLSEIQEAHAMVEHVFVPTEVKEALKDLRLEFGEEQLYVSDRRWRNSLAILKAEAFFRGHDEVETLDTRTLMHSLWNNLNDAKKVTKLVLELANPLDREAHDLVDAIIELEDELRKINKDGENQNDVERQAVEVFKKLVTIKKKMVNLKGRINKSGKPSESIGEVERRFVNFANSLLKKGFFYDDNIKEFMNVNK